MLPVVEIIDIEICDIYQLLEKPTAMENMFGYCGNGTWMIEIVDAGDIGFDTDIVVVDSDRLFISYYDLVKKNLKLACVTNGQWNAEVVDAVGDVGMFSSVAVDSLSNPHISYYDATNCDLKYAYWNGSAWSIVVVDSAGEVGLYTSIAVDSKDFPHITYYDKTNGDLKYACLTESGWNIIVIDSQGDVGFLTSLVLDSFDTPHISYRDEDELRLWYAYWTESGWSIAAADLESRVAASTSLALDSHSRPHICYYDTVLDSFSLMHAYLADAKWNVEVVDPDLWGFWPEAGASIAIDNFDRIHIGYYSWDEHNLNYAWKEQNSWIIETVDSEEWVGAYTALDVDPEGYPHVSYINSNHAELRYARKIQYCPETPQQPFGPRTGVTGNNYSYTTFATDFDGDMIRYGWEWDDDSGIVWTEFYNSGELVESFHSWEKNSRYQIRVIAEDEHGYKSDWSEPLAVTMPETKPAFKPHIWDRLSECLLFLTRLQN